MLPYSEHAPTQVIKVFAYQLVPLLVLCKFARPKQTVGSGSTAMYWATVPEATVDENGQAHPWKYKIWIAKNRRVPSPPLNFLALEDFQQANFRCLITSAPHQRHYLGASLCREYICHRRHRKRWVMLLLQLLVQSNSANSDRESAAAQASLSLVAPAAE